MRRNDDFFTWATNNVPYWEQLTKEELASLKKLHSQEINQRRIWSSTYSSATRSTSGVNYDTSIKKAEERLDAAQKELESYVEQLNKKYGVITSRTNETAHKK